MAPVLSIIIPTHKRAPILRECLRHIERQTVRDRLEVIVVSDGQDDATAALFKNSVSYQLSAISSFEIPKSHQGVARNRGVERAQGDICLFIGDDIFLEPDACERHLRCHGSTPLTMTSATPPFDSAQGDMAVLGFTTWDPLLTITPVMRWLERSGWQFGYPMIERYAHAVLPPEIQRRFTYTSHLSIPTSVARAHPFREDVSLYGWEDIEWGMRLRDAGIKLFYEPDARAYHHHPMTLTESLRRMETLGRSAVRMEKIAPGLRVVPRGWKKVAYQLISLLPTMRGRHAQAFLAGMEPQTAHSEAGN